MKARLIALDIDGTILDKPSGVSVPASVRTALSAARNIGVRVCLCSSRPGYFMEDATKDLDGIDALIGCCGAMIDEGGERIYADAARIELMLSAMKLAVRADAYCSFAAGDRILTLKKGDADPLDTGEPHFCVLEEKALVSTLRSEAVYCAFIFVSAAAGKNDILYESSFKGAAIHHSGNAFVITNKNTDKGTAVLRLAERYGISREAILAIGNDANDIPMLKAAGVSVAVANASREVLAAAKYVCPSVSEGGVAEAISRFVL